MGRKKTLHDATNLGFRVDGALLERLDTYCTQLETAHGYRPSRSDAVRMLLDRALAAEGIPAEGAKPKRKR